MQERQLAPLLACLWDRLIMPLPFASHAAAAAAIVPAMSHGCEDLSEGTVGSRWLLPSAALWELWGERYCSLLLPATNSACCFAPGAYHAVTACHDCQLYLAAATWLGSSWPGFSPWQLWACSLPVVQPSPHQIPQTRIYLLIPCCCLFV